ncbi:MAG: hypothetical protein ACTS85_00280 [Arsenophonus sp. NC-PG7-MAG3]
MRNQILKEFNIKYVSRYLESIINKEFILSSDEEKWYKIISSEHEISQNRLMTLDNYKVIGKEFHILNMNSYFN